MNAHRLAWLEDLPVVTEDGARLGHLFEIRSPGRAETEPIHDARKVGHFLCGKRGLRERLGWKEPEALAIPWSSVVTVGPRGIVVRGQAESFRKLGVS